LGMAVASDCVVDRVRNFGEKGRGRCHHRGMLLQTYMLTWGFMVCPVMLSCPLATAAGLF
jgi:hypothetical protein